MKFANCGLSFLASLLLLSTLAIAQSLGACPPTLKTPKPPKHFCGAHKAPVPGTAADNAIISSTPAVQSQEACLETCFGNPPCKAFTYSSDDGTCNTYRHGPPRLPLENSGDNTQFWNNECYNPPAVTAPAQFYLQVNGGVYNGQYVASSGAEKYRQAFFIPGNPGYPPTGSVFTLDCDGGLNDDDSNSLGVQIYQSGDGGIYHRNLYFVSSSTIQQYSLPVVPVTCTADINTQLLSCSSESGETFFACSNYGGGVQDGLDLAPSSGVGQAYYYQSQSDESCQSVTLSIIQA